MAWTHKMKGDGMMPETTSPADQSVAIDSPLSPQSLLDLYFLDARHKLIEIAAFLDRIERARACFAGTDQAMEKDDYRLASLREALNVVADGSSDKARSIRMIFSDPTTEPLESAGMQGAMGAWPGRNPS